MSDNGLMFEEVAMELSPSLARYLRRQVSDRALAEDLLQETLMRIASGLPSFEGRSHVKTWAFAIAARVAIDHFRRAHGEPATADLIEAADIPDGARPLDQAMVVDQMNECVRQVIDSLPEEYREAILLHHFRGLTAREAAAECGCSEANAKVRIHRGKAQLKKALEQECELYRDEENVLRCARKGEKR